MKQHLKNAIMLIFLISTCVSALWLVYIVALKIYTYTSLLQKEVVAALIAGSSTIIVSTITVVFAKYYESKKERSALYREKKVEIYDEFIKNFFTHFFNGNKENDPKEIEKLVGIFRDFMRKLLLWGDPNTINKYIEWKEYLSNNIPNAKTVTLTEEFFLSIRKDLNKNNKGIKSGFFASFILNNPALFLSLAKKDPTITLAQVAEIELMQKILSTENKNDNIQTTTATNNAP